jgi:16S rRNA (guanine966-N2)-methyltransferase
MRIISGKLKGRRFQPPAGDWPTRPTTDFAREALFNILNNQMDFEGIRALNLFGGTGSHSYELLSRGCAEVTYVERHPPCVAFAKKTAAELGLSAQMRIVRDDVFHFLSRHEGGQYHFVFADPPYHMPTIELLPNLILEGGFLDEDGIFVLEHSTNFSFEAHPNCYMERIYGKTVFSCFEPIGGPGAMP